MQKPRLAAVMVVAFSVAAFVGLQETGRGASVRPPVLGDPIVVAGVGFQGPESIMHDAVADRYLVSNLVPTGGFPNAIDNNGFIARVRPDGTIEQLRWIEGGVNGVTLHAPKGMAIVRDVLYVSDIDAVRLFDRLTGAPLGEVAVPYTAMMSWLNDLTAGPDGAVYAGDTAIGLFCDPPAPSCPSGTDAVYRIDPDGTLTTLVQDPQLGGPNGLVALGSNVLFVTGWGNKVNRLSPSGKVSPLAELQGWSLDGLVRLNDGSLLVSSWVPPAIHWIDPSGRHVEVIQTFTINDPENPFANQVPADIGFDAIREWLLIPFATYDSIGFYPLG